MSEIINGANLNKSGMYPGWKAKAAEDKAADDAAQAAKTEVKVTPIVESGTKIASIDVDGNSTDLYAPAGASGTATGLAAPDPIAATINMMFNDTQTGIVIDKTFAELEEVIDEFSVDYDIVFIEVTGNTGYSGYYAAFHNDSGPDNVLIFYQVGLAALNLAYPVIENGQISKYLADALGFVMYDSNAVSYTSVELTIPTN